MSKEARIRVQGRSALGAKVPQRGQLRAQNRASRISRGQSRQQRRVVGIKPDNRRGEFRNQKAENSRRFQEGWYARPSCHSLTSYIVGGKNAPPLFPSFQE